MSKESKDLGVAYAIKRRAKKMPMKSDMLPMPMPEHEEHYESIADAILAKKHKAKMMAEGGEVDSRDATLVDEAMDDEGMFDELNEDAVDDASETERDILKGLRRKRS